MCRQAVVPEQLQMLAQRVNFELVEAEEDRQANALFGGGLRERLQIRHWVRVRRMGVWALAGSMTRKGSSTSLLTSAR
jgi:hypothetical protein